MHGSVANRKRRPCARDSMENCRHDDIWSKNLVERITSKMGEKAILCEKQIDEASAYAAFNELQKGTQITIGMLKRRSDELIFSYSTIDHHLDKGDVLVVVGKIKNLKYFQEYYSSPRVV